MTIRNFAAALVLTLLSGSHAFADETLFHDLGEKAGLTRIVGTMIDLSLADPRTAKSFDNVNTDRVKKLIVEQFCQLTGGPCEYKGRSMEKSHKHLALTNMHFNALVENLQEAMDKEKVPFATQNKLLAILAPMQRDVVTH